MAAPQGSDSSWSSELGDWSERLRGYFDSAAALKITVLVWGPGKHHERWYKKRVKIVNDLKKMPGRNDVKTSEDLIATIPELATMPEHEAEEIQAKLADVIISLFVNDNKVDGAPSEVLLFGNRDDLQAKIRVLKPEDWDVRGFKNKTAAQIQPQPQYIDYTEDEFRDCHRIRRQCRQWVEAVRALKYRDLRRAHA